MAVKIRLARHGAKKKPFYRIVIANSESPRDGKFIERVGTYDPMINPASVVLKKNRIKYWIENGASPTSTVRSIFKKNDLC